MIALSLGPATRYVLVASPALLKAQGTPKHPRDLLERPCLVTRLPSGLILPWEFTKAGHSVKFTPQGPLMGATPSLQLQAALAGIGYALMFEDYAAAVEVPVVGVFHLGERRELVPVEVGASVLVLGLGEILDCAHRR